MQGPGSWFTLAVEDTLDWMVNAAPLFLPTTYSPGPGVDSDSETDLTKRLLEPIENFGPEAAGPRTEYAAGPGDLEDLRRERREGRRENRKQEGEENEKQSVQNRSKHFRSLWGENGEKERRFTYFVFSLSRERMLYLGPALSLESTE